jgi:hypothetical protein
MQDMSTDLIERARSGDEEAFRELVDPYRRELQLHCYRILGSLHDAEDGLQETLLAAWQGLRTFEGRSSIRTWLYRIATSRCLNLLLVPCARIRFVPDYSLLTVDGRTILCVGGATSSDRVLRTPGRNYWPDEGFYLDEQRIEALNLEGLWAVVTHTAPDFAPPLRLHTPPFSVPGDPDLFTDLRRERSALTRLHTLLTAQAHPAYWFYGHFHASAREEIAGTRFVMVASMEMYGVWSAGL